jgi:hypothetical protein
MKERVQVIGHIWNSAEALWMECMRVVLLRGLGWSCPHTAAGTKSRKGVALHTILMDTNASFT